MLIAANGLMGGVLESDDLEKGLGHVLILRARLGSDNGKGQAKV